MKKTKEEMMEERGLTKFVESYSINIPKENIVRYTETKLIESKGSTYKAKGVLKAVPVSRYTENLNKRVYNKALWENVSKKGMGEGSFALMGHPSDDGNPKDIAGV